MPDALRCTYRDTLTGGLKKFFEEAGISQMKTDKADKAAKTAAGLQFLNFTVNGSSKEPVTPPIWWGNLRATGSVHVGREFVGGNLMYPIKDKGGEHEVTKINNNDVSENADTITIGFNTSYATRMHETDWNPGPISRQSGNTGKKFLEKHLIADRETILEFYAVYFKKYLQKVLKETTG